MPTVENPIAYSLYFRTPSKTRAIPIKSIQNEAQAHIPFLFIPILISFSSYKLRKILCKKKY